jgi:regulatory protein
MATITGLTQQKRNKDRVNLFLDGQYAFSLSAIVAASLHENQTLTLEQIERLRGQDQLEKAKSRAYRYLSYRPRSIAEMQDYLRSKGYDRPLVEEVTGRLVELELLDDRSFAAYWVEQRNTFNPRSQMALRHELFQKGVDRDIVDDAVSEVDERAAALQAVEKRAARWISLPQEQFMLKVNSFLQRRGFGYTVISDVSRQLWESSQTGDDDKNEINLRRSESK